ncbi:hypothetical protein AWH51_03665 [Clavibacter tessellarius]|uniref:Uncharacterized protein n=1 Tax=Clavibacter tessellarius TaxID=31965 RepID=A0A154V4I0_9MICO|nr:hypothetical protein AWH51_03665 [Clavibacter michiganensis subsp. tessellarius]
MQDESPHNTVLGVFAREPEASQFADEVEARFPQGVIYTRFRVGYRYDPGPGHVEFGPAGD